MFRPAKWSRSAVMPPYCRICNASARNDNDYKTFTLVYFRAIAPPLAHEGHPENAVWFCKKHGRYTEGKTHMSAIEAMVHISGDPSQCPKPLAPHEHAVSWGRQPAVGVGPLRFGMTV